MAAGDLRWGLKCEGDILGLASSSLVIGLKIKVGLSGSRRKETEAGSEAETRELQLQDFLHNAIQEGVTGRGFERRRRVT